MTVPRITRMGQPARAWDRDEPATAHDDVAESRQWTDPPEPGRDVDDWPYPDEVQESIATGELAARCRVALGVADPDAEVVICERTVSGGYSEYTQENEYNATLTCDGRTQAFPIDGFDTYCQGNAFNELLLWLDTNAPKAER